MLSRRNVRIKVMQALYSMSTASGLSKEMVVKSYRSKVASSFDLYIFVLYVFYRVAKYATIEEENRKSKFRPTEEDLQFRGKLADNELIESIVNNEVLQKLFADAHLGQIIDQESIRILYQEFSKSSQEYHEYLNLLVTDLESHQEILLKLFKFTVGHENCIDIIEDHFNNWVDDQSLVIGAIKKTIKALPIDNQYIDQFRPDPEATHYFGQALLENVLATEDQLKELIIPNLQNWDADRVAIIDMLLIKMALAEFIHFPSIPTKVTLNEYVEISKLYSTDKSRDFINGILDRLLKKLQHQGVIKKEGRGLIE
jgi:N utilization substance protein B